MIKTIKRIKSLMSSKLGNFFFFLKNHKILPERKEPFKVALFGTPEYGNLGDHLIAFAEMKMLESFFGKDNLLEITENEIRFRLRDIKKLLNKNTAIVLQGGGNVSDVWCDQEKIRNKVIRNFSDNKIMLMPQTVFIKKSENYYLLDKYRERILFCARENFTYSFLKSQSIRNIYLCPDAALYLWDYCKKYRMGRARDTIGVCLRKDAESVAPYQEDAVVEFLKSERLEYSLFSTVKDEFIPSDRREEEIEKLLENIGSRELIITDRLHAMICAFLVGTPCIAISNSNRKIEGCYEWIKDADNIYFARAVPEALKKINEYRGKNNFHDFKYKDTYKEIISAMMEGKIGD